MAELKGWDWRTEAGVEQIKPLDRIVVYAAIALLADKGPNQGLGKGVDKGDDADGNLFLAKQSFYLSELIARLDALNIQPAIDMLEQSLTRLSLGFVLGQNEQGGYFFRVPLFVQLLLQGAPTQKLKEVVERYRRE